MASGGWGNYKQNGFCYIRQDGNVGQLKLFDLSFGEFRPGYHRHYPPTKLFYSSSGLYSLDDTVQSLGMPGYSGLSENWNSLYVQFWAAQEYNDTTTLRFTFASDSIQTNKDGWDYWPF